MNLLWEAFGGSLLGSLIGVFALGILGFLLRTWFGERIRQSIRHDFSLGLERYKDEIGKRTAQHIAMQSAANAALIEGQRVAAEWRIKACDAMWREIVEFKDKASSPMTMLDLLNPDEYQGFVTDSRFKSSILTGEEFLSLFSRKIEQERPFLGENLYALFFAYRAIIGRICYLLETDVAKGYVNPWFQDDGVRHLLRLVITPEQIKQFEELKYDRVHWMTNAIEGNILDELRRVIAGTQSVDDGLEQAKRILEEVQVVVSQTNEKRAGDI